MARMFRFVVLVLVFWNSQYASGTERAKITSSTETRVILEEDKREPENNEFSPAECFDKIWQIVDQHFWDPNFNGIDWKETGRRYRPLALSAENHESFAVIINQMLTELKTSHTRYFTKWEADYYTLQAALISGRLAAMLTSDTTLLEK